MRPNFLSLQETAKWTCLDEKALTWRALTRLYDETDDGKLSTSTLKVVL